ncbi:MULTISPECIES: hypothetical protein [Parabacteroides]|uniref:hypothetical protein n=1 Tax=Parabacteroides TaxID=375288 RepID=UPI002030AF8B|nr:MULTISPECIES: hypothetical protein [Parabacteroides]MCM0712065.1 hypothetical protein [Parabacteroides sp. TA-V-105]
MVGSPDSFCLRRVDVSIQGGWRNLVAHELPFVVEHDGTHGGDAPVGVIAGSAAAQPDTQGKCFPQVDIGFGYLFLPGARGAQQEKHSQQYMFDACYHSHSLFNAGLSGGTSRSIR